MTTHELFTVVIDEGNGPTAGGKLADAAVVFTEAAGPLAGLKLIGFAVWQRRNASGFNVTFPARQYSVNGERRSFALLRPAGTTYYGSNDPNEAIRHVIVAAYEAHVEAREQAAEAEARPLLHGPDETAHYRAY